MRSLLCGSNVGTDDVLAKADEFGYRYLGAHQLGKNLMLLMGVDSKPEARKTKLC